MLRQFLLSASILACSASLAFADEGSDRLQPRFETGLKYGIERTIGSGEVWVPLDQGQDRVLYGDLRLMGDDDDNTEGNLGIGYRQIIDAPLIGQTVAGVHGWIDRRHTDRDNNFHQVTLGAELLGRDLDLRANAYLPLNDEKSYATPNIGNAAPYLAGAGIFYDTTGTAIEEPQPGLDLEIGYRLPDFQEQIEALRFYAGGYHFEGDQTEDVTGWRTRVVADISPAVSIGGRWQRDDERGSQGFIEATLRFPFSAKKSFRAEGLRARLDESPERDIDIVAGGKVTDTGLAKPVLAAATGEQQRVLHVDNTAAPGGDGSKEHPFHQLKLAEAALQANDVIYVHAGDGTSTGQDLGIVIDKPGVALIGSGSDFIYDAGRFTTDRTAGFNDIVLAEATTAPVITNNTLGTGEDSGNGIFVNSNSAVVSGLDIKESARYGLFILADNKIIKDISVYNINTEDNIRGIYIKSRGASSIIENISIENSSAIASDITGIYIRAEDYAQIGEVNIQSIFASSSDYGIRIDSTANSQMKNVLLHNVIANGNNYGIHIYSREGSSIERSEIVSAASYNNNFIGLLIEGESDGYLNFSVKRSSIYNNGRDGIRVNDDTNALFIADLGEGTFPGGNSIYGNGTSNPAAYYDVRLDLDGSLTPLPAQGNWWGQPGGPTAGQINSEGAGSPPAANTGTADTSNALDSDPNL